MNKHLGELAQARPITGNANAIDGEVRRLHDLKERLCSTGEVLGKLYVDGWRGRASDAFEDFRYAFARQWLMAGDYHEEAARALERYRDTLMELQARARNTHHADVATAAADLSRWRQQLDSEGTAAAAAIRRAARALAALPRLLNHPEPGPNAPAAGPARKPAPDPGLDPRNAASDRAAFRQRVQALNDAVLAADVVVTAPVGSDPGQR